MNDHESTIAEDATRRAAMDTLQAPRAAEADDAFELVPVVADRYTMLGKIGEGGMSRVYRAWDRRLERQVALKLLKHSRSRDLGFARLLREALEVFDDLREGQHSGAAATRVNLAAILNDGGAHEEAEAEARRALVTMKALFGPDHPDHPDLIACHSVLAEILDDAGRHEEALAEARSAVASAQPSPTAASRSTSSQASLRRHDPQQFLAKLAAFVPPRRQCRGARGRRPRMAGPKRTATADEGQHVEECTETPTHRVAPRTRLSSMPDAAVVRAMVQLCRPRASALIRPWLARLGRAIVGW